MSVQHQYRYRTIRQVRYDINAGTGHFGTFGMASIPVPRIPVPYRAHPCGIHPNIDPASQHSRAIIRDPASVAASAMGDEGAHALRRTPRRTPREGRWRFSSSFPPPPLILSRLITYARKPSNNVRLNASRTSKRRVSCRGMSWSRNEMIHLHSLYARSSSYSMLR